MSIKIIPDGKRRTSPRRSCRTAGAAQGAHYARHPHPARWKLNIIRTENEPPSEDRRVPSDFWYQRGLRFHGSCSGYRRQERRPYAGWFLIVRLERLAEVEALLALRVVSRATH